MTGNPKRQAAASLRRHARTLDMLLHPATAAKVRTDDVRAARDCFRELADALDQNANTEN